MYLGNVNETENLGENLQNHLAVFYSKGVDTMLKADITITGNGSIHMRTTKDENFEDIDPLSQANALADIIYDDNEVREEHFATPFAS